ncbi:MAG: biosynthetic-type acetolactate synthase large subunit [Clostridiaceae bacterium]|nr:biosynthetic-type acetolactate synthase large subunit [Clostridiaceae bacterium]
MKLNGSEIIIKLLEQQGIKNIAGIPGGANLPLYDALYKSSINHILCRHEQGGAFIAQGMTRSTGEVAVCFATSGPGATNLLTAVADAKLDSIPIICITGQVAYPFIGTDAFQEVDTYGLTIPITKHNFIVRSAKELFLIIPEAFRVAKEGRPGPVLIDVPKDVQQEIIELDTWPELEILVPQQNSIDRSMIEWTCEQINKAKRPILYIGGGVLSGNASQQIRKLANKNNIPVVTTLMGLGCFSCDEPLYLSMLGMHGTRYTNILLHEADLLLAFGVRFDDRATGNIKKFCPEAEIIHVDIDEAEINKLKSVDYSITGDIKAVLEELLPLVEENKREGWLNFVEDAKTQHPFILPPVDDLLHPINIIKYVSNQVAKDSIITTDVGQHQMWTAQVYPFRSPRTLLTSGGLGTMGFGLPAAIGAALENPDKQVICFTGDGSILMNIQELATLADLNLNVKIIILNNKHLGLVRQQQELFYSGHYIASKFITNPDFATISRGFGIPAYDLSKEIDLMGTLKKALVEPGPVLINVPVRETENVYPMVRPGAPITEMIGGEVYDK